MTFTHEGRTYTVAWHHDARQRLCICSIDVEIQCIAMGRAQCHPRDRYSRPTARRLTLARALRALRLPRPARTLVWRLYFAQHSDARRLGIHVGATPEAAGAADG